MELLRVEEGRAVVRVRRKRSAPAAETLVVEAPKRARTGAGALSALSLGGGSGTTRHRLKRVCGNGCPKRGFCAV